jgi:hypothetical protein
MRGRVDRAVVGLIYLQPKCTLYGEDIGRNLGSMRDSTLAIKNEITRSNLLTSLLNFLTISPMVELSVLLFLVTAAAWALSMWFCAILRAGGC